MANYIGLAKKDKKIKVNKKKKQKLVTTSKKNRTKGRYA
tara:strand:+ start:299 stop:415 length:117 start_codon:yes stop_codon:yes gene_type:complete